MIARILIVKDEAGIAMALKDELAMGAMTSRWPATGPRHQG
jgi:hypothetical protein